MPLEARNGAAIALGYSGAIATWLAVSLIFPQLWPRRDPKSSIEPGLDLAIALAAGAAVFGLNVLHHRGLLLTSASRGSRDSATFLANLAIIWSPLLVALLLRRQGPASCLFAFSDFWIKLIWGLLLSIVGVTIYGLVELGGTLATLFSRTYLLRRMVDIVQGAVQYLGFGFFLARLASALGNVPAALLSGALYGMAKYPMLLTHYKFRTSKATVVVLFSASIATGSLLVALYQQDIIALSLIHSFMDRTQHQRRTHRSRPDDRNRIAEES